MADFADGDANSRPLPALRKKSATRSRNQPQMKDAMRWVSREQKSSLKHVSLLQESSRCPLMKTRLSEQNCRTPKNMTTCNVFICRCLTLVDFSKIQNSKFKIQMFSWFSPLRSNKSRYKTLDQSVAYTNQNISLNR